MSTFPSPATLAGACSILLRQARDMAGKNYAMNLGRKLGALDFITSPDNGSLKAVEYTQAQGGKKIVTAKVLYKQRILPCEIQSGVDALDATLCDTTVSYTEKSVNMNVGDGVASSPIKFTNSDLVQICQGSMEFMQEYIVSQRRALREKLSEKILAKIATNAGVNNRQNGVQTATGTYTSVSLMGSDSAGNKIPLSANWNDVLMDYQNNQFNGTPAFIGQGNLQTAFELMKYSCCNASTPYADAIGKANSAFFLDQAANKVLGTNGALKTRALMVAFGASHLLWFNENTNININNELVQHIVLQDEVYPTLKWDLDFKWDECAKSYIYQQKAYFDVFNVFQSNSFKTDDPSPNCDDELAGETGIWKYEFASV